MKSKLTLDRILANLPAKIIALAVAVLLFLFNRIETVQERSFSVPVKLITENGLTPGENYLHRVKITLRGAEEIIFPVQEEDIEAVSDFSDHQSEGVYRNPIKIVRRNSALDAANLEITVEPIEMTLKLERKLSKSLEVLPRFSGRPTAGHELDGYKLTPSFVTVEGPASRVEKLTQARTENIDLRGKSEPFSVRIRLLNDDPLLSFPGGSVVEVQAGIKPMVSSMAWESLVPTISNLPRGLKVTTPPGEVKLRLKGSQKTLEETRSQPSVVRLDLGFMTKPGTYKIRVQTNLPPEIEVLELQPAEVSVTLEASE